MLIYAFDSGPESGELLLGRRALIVVGIEPFLSIVQGPLNQLFCRTRLTTRARLSSKYHSFPVPKDAD